MSHDDLIHAKIRMLRPDRCPHAIIVPSHYRDDGSCRCDDPTHTEMEEWGYSWVDNGWS